MKNASIASLLFLAACSSSTNGATTVDVPPGSNGVNDVRAACGVRAQWANATASACNTCIAEVESPKCPCSDFPAAGVCATQEAAMRDEPTCAGVSDCIAACAKSDCVCIDTCYAGKSACREAASAADGCVANACDSYCR